MRIMLLGDYQDDPRLGSAKVYHKLGDELRRLGHDVDVLLAPALGARPASPRARWALSPVLAARAARRAMRRSTYDVIDAASAEGLWLATQRRAGRLPRTAVVARSHGLEQLNYRRMIEDDEHGLIRKPLSRRLFYPAVRLSQVAAAARLADRLIVLNRGDADYAARTGWQPPARIDIIPHGVSESLLDAAAPQAEREGILFCGTWTGVKGTDYLVAAMSQLPAARLTVLGPGTGEAAVLAQFPASVRNRISVIPRVDEAEVIAHMRRHALLVACSTYEGFGMVVLEAMTQHLPVVATPVGCAPELVNDGVTGLLVPPRDGAAIAAAARRLLDDPALRHRIADAAFERVQGMTWRRTAERTIESYQAAQASA